MKLEEKLCGKNKDKIAEFTVNLSNVVKAYGSGAYSCTEMWGTVSYYMERFETSLGATFRNIERVREYARDKPQEFIYDGKYMVKLK